MGSKENQALLINMIFNKCKFNFCYQHNDVFSGWSITKSKK